MSNPTAWQDYCLLIDSFYLQKPCGPTQLECVEIAPEVTCNELGSSYKIPSRSLWLDPTIHPGIDRLREQIGLWLAEHDHPASDAIVDALLFVMGVMRQRCMESPKILECIGKSLVDSHASHFFIMPQALDDDGQISFGGFDLSALNEQALRSRCDRAKSDFFEKYKKQIRGKLCIQSPVYSRKVLNLVSWLAEIQSFGPSNSANQAVLAYFEAVSKMHLKMMWHDFSEKQLIHLGLGSPLFLNVREIEKMLGAQPVTIYLKLSLPAGREVGFVVPSQQGKSLYLPPLAVKAAHMEAVSERYRLSSLDQAPLYPLLLNVCRSISNATSLAEEARYDESFIASIIALEQVFSSERTGIARAISGRTAALIHRQLNMTFEDAAKMIRRFYDSRSKFVHEGTSVPLEDRRQIKPVLEALVKAMISLCDVEAHPDPVNHQEWLAKLDAIRERLKNGEHIGSSALLKAGILEAFQTDTIVTP